MAIALNRHYGASKFATRKAEWIATSHARCELGNLLFLKKTARPCSCIMCKRPRYKRPVKHKQVAAD